MPKRKATPARTSFTLSDDGDKLLAATSKVSGLSRANVIRTAILLHALNRQGKQPHRVKSHVYGTGCNPHPMYFRPEDLRALDLLIVSYCGGNRSHIIEAALRAEANAVVAYMTVLTVEERLQLQSQIKFETDLT